jgi:hypothetical protein
MIGGFRRRPIFRYRHVLFGMESGFAPMPTMVAAARAGSIFSSPRHMLCSVGPLDLAPCGPDSSPVSPGWAGLWVRLPGRGRVGAGSSPGRKTCRSCTLGRSEDLPELHTRPGAWSKTSGYLKDTG